MSQSSRRRIMGRIRRGELLTVQDMRKIHEAWAYDHDDQRLGRWVEVALLYVGHDEDFEAMTPHGMSSLTRTTHDRGWSPTLKKCDFVSKTGLRGNFALVFQDGVSLSFKRSLLEHWTRWPRESRTAYLRAYPYEREGPRIISVTPHVVRMPNGDEARP